MADDEAAPSIRLVNFVSEDQLEEARRTRGARIEDGTAQRDRSLYEVLKENKDKKDAEFNERFKHRPPKALDEDETEFLDKLEMTRREYERQMAEEELQQLRSFQAAVASQTNVMHEQKDTPSVQKNEDKSSLPGKKNPSSRAPGMLIKLMPKAKKAKLEDTDPQETVKKAVDEPAKATKENKDDEPDDIKISSVSSANATDAAKSVALGGLVSYSDESEGDE